MKIRMRPIEVLVWFQTDREPQPLKFNIESKEGGQVSVKVEQIIGVTENKFAGNPMNVYKCKAEIGGKMRPFELRFEKKTRKWFLYKI